MRSPVQIRAPRFIRRRYELLLRELAGESGITSGDLAAAMVDELEHPQFSRRRFTVGYSG